MSSKKQPYTSKWWWLLLSVLVIALWQAASIVYAQWEHLGRPTLHEVVFGK